MPKIDWSNLEQVINYCQQLGSGMLVVKHHNRPNYNVTHASRKDLWDKDGVTVLFKT